MFSPNCEGHKKNQESRVLLIQCVGWEARAGRSSTCWVSGVFSKRLSHLQSSSCRPFYSYFCSRFQRQIPQVTPN